MTNFQFRLTEGYLFHLISVPGYSSFRAAFGTTRTDPIPSYTLSPVLLFRSEHGWRSKNE